MDIHPAIVADVFAKQDQATHALEVLRQAGFGFDQVGVAMQGHGNNTLLHDLLNLGVPQERASYYAQQVNAGYIVVSVRPDEVHDIMLQSGAFSADNGTAADETTITEKRQAAWDQAMASHQARLSAQMTTNTDEDFYRPRSIKPREEPQPVNSTYVQTGESNLRTDGAVEQKSDVAPVVQSDTVREQHAPLVEQLETTSIDEEETLRRPIKREQVSAETPTPPIHLEKRGNRKLVGNGILLGGLILGLGVSVLVAILRREQIRQFARSTTRTMKQYTDTIKKRSRND
ncbi:MAG: hypothetical protein NVS4B12_27420 [Ktedonobacteraceae bacterium]